MKRILVIQIGTIVTGLVIVWGFGETGYVLPLAVAWLIIANALLFSLKCEKCGRRLVFNGHWWWTRFFGLRRCAYCGHLQEKQ